MPSPTLGRRASVQAGGIQSALQFSVSGFPPSSQCHWLCRPFQKESKSLRLNAGNIAGFRNIGIFPASPRRSVFCDTPMVSALGSQDVISQFVIILSPTAMIRIAMSLSKSAIWRQPRRNEIRGPNHEVTDMLPESHPTRKPENH